MDDNRIQATRGCRSIKKRRSGCEHKRGSSFLGNSSSETKLISDKVAGIRLFPGAAAPLKKSRGGEKKGSSRHHDHIGRLQDIKCLKLLTVNMEVSWHPFLGTALLFLIMISINLAFWRCI